MRAVFCQEVVEWQTIVKETIVITKMITITQQTLTPTIVAVMNKIKSIYPLGWIMKMVAGTSHTYKDPTNVSGEDVVRSQVQTDVVETSLP